MDLKLTDLKISSMVIALALIAAWVVLNVALLGAIAFVNHRGQLRATRPAVKAAAPVRRSAPGFVVAR